MNSIAEALPVKLQPKGILSIPGSDEPGEFRDYKLVLQ
jgi:hypothetical protein